MAASAVIGCRTLIATDLQAGRLDLGATRTFNASQVDLVQAIQEMGAPPSVVIECSGQPKPIQQAIRVAGAHGRIALAGRPSRPLQDFTIEDVFHNLLTVMGGKVPAAGYTPRYRSIVLEMIRDQRIHANRHITHVLPLDRVGDASDPLRPGITCGPQSVQTLLAVGPQPAVESAASVCVAATDRFDPVNDRAGERWHFQRSRRTRSTRSSAWCAPAPPTGAMRGRCSFNSTSQSSLSSAATIGGQT